MEHAMQKHKDNLKGITDEKSNASNVCRLFYLRWLSTTTKTKYGQTCTKTGYG
jgi:hypothetical protein